MGCDWPMTDQSAVRCTADMHNAATLLNLVQLSVAVASISTGLIVKLSRAPSGPLVLHGRSAREVQTQCLGSNNISLRRDAQQKCQQSPGMMKYRLTHCHHTDPALFNCMCIPEDSCQTVEIGDLDSYQATTPLRCPLPASPVLRTGLGCLYVPLPLPGQPAAQSLRVERGYTLAQDFINAMLDSGKWDCMRRTWRPASGRPLHIWTGERLPRGVDAIATFGDSNAANIASGLSLVANQYNLSRTSIRHQKQETPIGGEDDLPIVHFNFTAVSGAFRLWVRSLSLQRILVIAQVGMHDLDYAHLNFQAGQIDALFNLSQEFRSHGIIMHTLWVRHQGSGAVKPLGMYTRHGHYMSLVNQQTAPLRKWDAEMLRAIKVRPSLILDPFEITQAAECAQSDLRAGNQTDCSKSCQGAFESFDGTHISPTVAANLGNILWRLIDFLPRTA